MKKIVLLVLFILFYIVGTYAQVIFTDGFESGSFSLYGKTKEVRILKQLLV